MQLMRTRNFRVRNDVVERGSVTKSQKGKKASFERKVGECFQWKAHGQCSKGDSCSFSHDTMASGNSGAGQRRKGRSSSPASHSKAKQTDGEGQKSSKESAGILPCVRITSLNENRRVHGDKCHFRHVEAEGKPSKKSKKGGAKGSVEILKGVQTIGLCISRFLSKKVIENWDRNTPSNSPKAPGTILKFGKERVHGEELSKSVRLMSEVLARRNSGKDHMRRPCTKKDAPAEQRGIWRNIFTSSRTRTKLRSVLLLKQR